MEKINNIFLNYKTYNAFLRDLNAGKISPNSIAFIQDNLRIWAHGKEYACNGLTILDAGEGSMSFVDAFGNTVLTLSADPNGYLNISGITGDAYDVFISKGDFANYVEVVEQLKRDFEKYKSIVVNPDLFVQKTEFNDVLNSDLLVKRNEIESILEDYNSRNSKMVTLSASAYQYLVENNLVDRNTYYFTYEGTGPSGDTWQFGDPFPIILTENWAFGGTFPITLK